MYDEHRGVAIPPLVTPDVPVLTPPRNVLLPKPEAPDNFTVASTGILIPKSKKADTEDDRILLPSGDQDIAPFLKPETSTTSREAIIHYLAAPWEYFGKKLEDSNLPSPTQEITEKIQKQRDKNNDVLAKLTDADKILLRSRIDYIREMALEKLREAGVSDAEITDLYRSQDQIVDVADLDFSSHEPEADSSEQLNRYKDFILRVFSDLIDSSVNNLELSGICSYLIQITEAFQYRHQIYKIEQDELIDILSEKLTQLSPEALQSKALWDFISHFKLTDNVLGSLYELMISGGSQQHPLYDHITFRLGKAEPFPEIEHIGMELEGLPKMFLGGIYPSGFEMGVDGGGTQPELRKSVNSISFGPSFYNDLYELWYWTRMSRFHGISLHLHVDNNRENLLNRYISLFGNHFNTIRTSYETLQPTIELRFNFANYHDRNYDLTTQFNPDHYALKGFISDILRVKQAKQFALNSEGVFADGYHVGKDLDPFWQRFKPNNSIEKLNKALEENKLDAIIDALIQTIPNGTLQLEEFILLAEKVQYRSLFMMSLINKLQSGALTEEMFLTLIDKVIGGPDFITSALRILPQGGLSLEQFQRILENSKVFEIEGHLQKAIEKLSEGSMTLDALDSIRKQSTNLNTLELAFSKLPKGALSLDVLSKILPDLESFYLIRSVISKLPEGEWTPETFLSIVENQWKPTTFRAGLDNLPDGTWTLEYVIESVKRSQGHPEIIKLGLDKLYDGNIPLDVVRSFAEEHNWSAEEMTKCIQSMTSAYLTYDLFLYLCQKYDWNRDLLQSSVGRLCENSLTYDTLMQIAERCDWDNSITSRAIEKLPDGAMELGMLKRFITISDMNYLVTLTALQKLPPGGLTVDELLSLNLRSTLLPTAVEKLPEGEVSLSDLFRIKSQSEDYIFEITCSLISKLPDGCMNYNDLRSIVVDFGDSKPAIACIQKYPDSSMTLSELIKLSDLYEWDLRVVDACLSKLQNGAWTTESLMNFDIDLEVTYIYGFTTALLKRLPPGMTKSELSQFLSKISKRYVSVPLARAGEVAIPFWLNMKKIY